VRAECESEKMNENQTKFYPKQAVACGLIPYPFRGKDREKPERESK